MSVLLRALIENQFVSAWISDVPWLQLTYTYYRRTTFSLKVVPDAHKWFNLCIIVWIRSGSLHFTERSCLLICQLTQVARLFGAGLVNEGLHNRHSCREYITTQKSSLNAKFIQKSRVHFRSTQREAYTSVSLAAPPEIHKSNSHLHISL